MDQTDLRWGSYQEFRSHARHAEELGIDVPVEMRDWYPDGTGEIRGVGAYGRFRRFQVKTDEALK